MSKSKSFLKYAGLPVKVLSELASIDDRQLTPPSVILSDGLVTVPLFAVSSLSLNEAFHLPPIGSSGVRTAVAAHDDTLSLNGVLVGPERFLWKVLLEALAEISKRGSALAAISSGRTSGLILVTSMTIRTDIQVQSLSFSMTAARRDVIDVTMSLAHLPLPGSPGLLLDEARLGVAMLADVG